MKKHTTRLFLIEGIGVLISLLFILPLYFVLINSFKPYSEMMTSFISFPKSLYLNNYLVAWKATDYIKSFTNSLLLTTGSVTGIVLLASMASYMLARTKNTASMLLYYVFTLGMIIPFHSLMIFLVKWAAMLNMTKSLWGLMLIYWGLGCPFAVFMMHGFIKSIPTDIEEAAVIDGCGPFRKYWLVVFPLLKPVTSTVAVLDVLWIWNDFLLPMLLIFMNRNIRTIPLTQYNLYGEYNSEWNVALAAVVIGVTPVLVFFLFMQKFIIRGITAGSVKG